MSAVIFNTISLYETKEKVDLGYFRFEFIYLNSRAIFITKHTLHTELQYRGK